MSILWAGFGRMFGFWSHVWRLVACLFLSRCESCFGCSCQDDLQQLNHTIGWNSTGIANFREDKLKFLGGHFLARPNVEQDFLHTLHDNAILGILRRRDDFFLET